MAYLNSRIGTELLNAEFQGNVQEHLSLPDARRLPVPIASDALQAAIERIFERVIALKRESLSRLQEAEGILGQAIGLSDWSPPSPLHYSASFSTLSKARRLDSQFFAPRYRDLLARLKRDNLTLSSVARPRRDRFDANNTQEIDYIEIGDLAGDGTTTSTRLASVDAPSRATWRVRAGDVITSCVRPIRRLSALIAAKQDRYVCSSGFVVLEPTATSPEVLLTYLRHPLICELMDLFSSASMYPAISEDDLLAMPFAAPDASTDRAIAAAVQSAGKAREESARLLQAAVGATATSIEINDRAALELLTREGV